MKQLNRIHMDLPNTLPLKVMQFGGGNFLRAFIDWMVQVLNEQTNFNGGVVIIKPTAGGDYKALKTQDGLFTVILDGVKNGALVAEKKIVACVSEVVNPYSEWEAYLALANNPGIRFITSNTTEAGIRFNPNDAFEDKPPKEFPAKLTIWLYRRFQNFNGDSTKGCILLPLELIEDNGLVLKEVIIKYSEHWQLGNAFRDWVETANYFCNTLVDRIVSGYPKDRAAEIQDALEYTDALLVAGEQYHSWVIQGPELVQKELPFEKTQLNVAFVNDLVPYRKMKVRILNGAHTAMVPVGYLAGIRFVKDAMDDQDVSDFVEKLLLEEAAHTLDFPDDVKCGFVADVLDRFRNPLLKHQLISISLNSTSKFTTRLLPTLKDYLNSEERLPKRIVFGLSALLLFYKGEFNGAAIDVKDDSRVIELFAEQWEHYTSNKTDLLSLVQGVLGKASIWGEDLNRLSGLSEMVAQNIGAIQKDGVEEALKNI
ncbi:tagaturonate reductase [Maribacter sp.]|nr:tagaturonate reductase [Maribacter sp.]